MIEIKLWENLFMVYANNKGANQPHPCSLISTFAVRCLDSIMSILAKYKISRLVSLYSWAGRFESHMVEDQFFRDMAHFFLSKMELENLFIYFQG